VDLDDAVRQPRTAQAALPRAEQRAAAIIAADRSGMRQPDIVDATGYSRERVRQIIRGG
jgi:hypothetical protein